jgi:hypothetical protein
MSILVENPNANANARERETAAAASPRPQRRIPQGVTALTADLKDEQIDQLGLYFSLRYTALHNSLDTWRTKLEILDRISNQNRQDRRGAKDQDHEDGENNIFRLSNHSLGLVAGFADFAYAQARDEIFGTTPYFAATPQGRADNDLADLITKHAHWKLDQTSTVSAYCDALRQACDLGTSFVKTIWRKEIETYQKLVTVAHGPDKQPLFQEDGTLLTTDDEPPQDMEITSWERMLVPAQSIVYDNIATTCIDFRDIAFDATAHELDTLQTDIYQRVKIGLLDAKSTYHLTEEQYQAARDLVGGATTGQHTANPIHGEHKSGSAIDHEEESNPPITLVEGYARCSPFGPGQPPVRVFVVFAPDLQQIFHLDYLANHTPDGLVPIKPLRCFKIPNRILGKGYIERFQDVEDFIDAEFNSVTYRDRLAANPIGGYNPDAFAQDMEEEDAVILPGKLFRMKPGTKIDDGFSFATVPDANAQAISLLNMMAQMAQMRTGITSAAQGEMKGVPSANTATGTNQIISRGATLLKWPIDTFKNDIDDSLEFTIHLIYANQDHDETFTWGEGESTALLEIARNDVHGLRLNVGLTLTQSQSQTKLTSATTAISIHGQYVMLPEPEKQSARPLFIQAVKNLGFNSAEDVIRKPVADIAAIAALLPPELQQSFIMIAQQMGLIAPEAAAGPEDPAGPAAPIPPSTGP